MQIFKNGINVKWLLLVIGILAVSGIAIATTDPIIGDNINYLDALNITRWIRATQFIDANNTAYYVDPAGTSNLNGVNATAVNSTGNGIFGSSSNRIMLDSTTGRIGGGTHSPNRVLDLTGFAPDHAVLLPGYYWGFSSDNGAQIPGGWGWDGTDYTTASAFVSGSGTAVCIGTGTTIKKNAGQTTCVASSETVKHNIETLPSIDNFDKVRPVQFIYNNDKQNRERVGMLAEEIALIYPEVVNVDYQGNGTFMRFITNITYPNKASGALYSDGKIANITGISYELYTAILTKKIQEQQFQLETQASQIRNICTNNPQLCS